MYVVVAVGETDNEGVLAVVDDEAEGNRFIHAVAVDWYPVGDLAVVPAQRWSSTQDRRHG